MEIILPIYLVVNLFILILFIFSSRVFLINCLEEDKSRDAIIISGTLMFLIFLATFITLIINI
jgi:hypothetical protein